MVPEWEVDYYAVDIPDVALMQDKTIQAYIYVEEEDSGVTVYQVD